MADELRERLKRAADGETVAGEWIYKFFRPLIVARVVRTYGWDPSRGEDVLNETLSRAFMQLEKTLAADDPKYWIFAIARNVAFEMYRNEKRETANTTPVEDHSLAAHGDDDDEVLYKRTLIRQILSQLSRDQREALVLTSEGLTQRAVAAIQGGTQFAAKQRIFRARANARRLLAAAPPKTRQSA